MRDLVMALGDWAAASGSLVGRLAGSLRGVIESGVLPPGYRFPSERTLARELAVSRSTVVAAFAELRSAGLVETRHGSGTKVARRPRVGGDDGLPSLGAPIFGRLLARTGRDDALISFAYAATPGNPAIAEEVLSFSHQELVDLLDDPGYLPRGLPALREALAALVTADGLGCDAESVLVTSGAHQAVTLCASLLVRPGDLVLVENPTYPGCVDAFASAGARLVSLPTDAEGMVVDGLEGVLSHSSVAAMFVMPTFQNPTGSLMAGYRRRRIAEVAGRFGVPVIEDNALSHTHIGPVEVPPPIASYPGAEGAPVITLGSLSKALWGGLRVGWLRAPQPWLERLARRKVAMDMGSGVLDQAVAARVLARFPDPRLANAPLFRDRLAHTEALLRERLPGWTWRRPTGGPSLWVRLPYEAGPFCQVALRHGVELVPGDVFGVGGSFSDHVRIPFTVEPAVMDEAVARLVDADRAHRSGARGEARVLPPRLVV